MSQNNIPTTQNAEPQERLLRARRQSFSRGKRLLSLQLVLTIGVPVLGSLFALRWPNLKSLVAFASLSIAILDVTIFDRLQQKIRQVAAKMQEQFDCTVLELPWDPFTVGSRVDPETIHEASKSHNKGQPDPELADWYPTIVGDAPLHLARIICQRTNLWYDSKMRRQYGAWILGITIGLSLLLGAFGIVGGLTIESFVLTVLAPSAPIVIWGLREYYRQRDAAEVLERLKSEAEGLWDRAKKGQCADTECATQSRQFQNAIYETRRRSPIIFGWIYRFHREKLEDQMKHGAEAFVKQLT